MTRMSTGLVTVTRLRRREAVQVVLVHGLFSNSAFWLPELGRLARFQLTLLGIDYARMLEQGVPLEEAAGQAEALIGPAPAHLVCHSFGCWLGSRIMLPLLSRAYICPTFAATAFDADAFCAAVGTRLGIDPASAAPLVERAVGHKARVEPPPRVRPQDELYLPEDDPFFSYAAPAGASAFYYRGGHFDVAEPMAAIARRLDPSA